MSPARQAANPDAAWSEVEVAWYGGSRRVMRVLTGLGSPLPLDDLVARDPEGTQRDAASSRTDGKPSRR